MPGSISLKHVILSSFILTLSFCISCQKDTIGNTGSPEPPTDLTAKVTSGKISGFVLDDQNHPVQHATVVVGNLNTTTNLFGYFEVNGALVTKTVGTVVVSQPGYFKGIRSFYAEEGGTVSVQIKLIPKTISGTINAGNGGEVSLPNGLTIHFPQNAVVDNSSGASYSGTVQVFSSWINPIGQDLWLTMPGDLRGLNENGTLKLLTTYGMAAVELTGSSGELLQMAPGKKASLTMPLPAAIAGIAPATIPLWYFDETKGLWKQEGRATKNGNSYVGEVAHFSFWNCDSANSFIQLSLTVKDENGAPVQNAIVKLTANNALNQVAYGYTNSNGYVSGSVPVNANIQMDIFGTFGCNTPSLSQNFSTGTTNQSLGDFTINMAQNQSIISGVLINCSGNPVSHGAVLVIEHGWYTQYPIHADGSFSIGHLLCGGPTNISLIGIDEDAGEQSSAINFQVTSGQNLAGTIQTCGISTTKYIHYSIDGGQPISLVSPTDSISISGNGTSLTYYMGGTTFDQSNHISFSFSSPGAAVGSVQNLQQFWASSFGQTLTISNPSCVNITEFGAIGEFIAGNFNAHIIDGASTHQVSCNFRILRPF